MLAVVVVAAAAGVGLTLALTGSPAQAPAAVSSGTPTPGPSSGTIPGGGEASEIAMVGTVAAVTSTSITIAGNGLSVTAEVTSATKITGQVGGIGQIKVGDQVSAQMTQRGTKITAVAIQDPAQQAVGPP
jgi:hypothetical protein